MDLRRQHRCCASLPFAAVALAVAGGLLAGPARGEPFSARIAFGYGDNPPERWQGSIRAERARITELGGWLIGDRDRVELNAFDIRTRHPARPQAVRKGILVRGTADPGGRLEVSSDQGDFSVHLEQPVLGRELELLGGGVRVSVMPSAERLTDDTRYDDYPSVAVAPNGASWLVWQSYGAGSDEIRIRKLDEN